MTRKKSFLLALLVAGVLAIPLIALAAIQWVGQRIQDSLAGPMHSFQLDATPPSLSDALAVEKAKQALALDGYDLAVWQPREDRRSTAPDSTPDVYLARNADNPNSGYVVFVCRSPNGTPAARCVNIELTGDRVTCQGIHPK